MKGKNCRPNRVKPNSEDSENYVNEQHIMSFTTLFKNWGKIRKAGRGNGHEIEQQIQIFPNGYIKVLTLTR